MLVEGNYLLLEEEPWRAIRDLLDEAWYLEPDDETRVERLVARHVRYGKSLAVAREWVLRSDEANTRRIAGSRHRTDVLIPGWTVASPSDR